MRRSLWTTGLVVVAATLSACARNSAGEPESAKADHGEEEHGSGGASFKEGRGLQLSTDVVRALGLKTAEAEERLIADQLRLTAQVFATTPQVLASATMAADKAESVERHPFNDAKLVRIDRSRENATRMVDVIVALERTPSPHTGDFVEISINAHPEKALTVPRSALLDAATGTFVYVVNSGAYLRTPVKLGAQSANFVEVAGGLYIGDTVVAEPVNQLWLAELRLTKGGGHGH